VTTWGAWSGQLPPPKNKKTFFFGGPCPGPDRSPPPRIAAADSVRTVRALRCSMPPARPLTGQRKRNPPPCACCETSAHHLNLPKPHRRAQPPVDSAANCSSETPHPDGGSPVAGGRLCALLGATDSAGGMAGMSEAGPWPSRSGEPSIRFSYRAAHPASTPTRQRTWFPRQHQPPLARKARASAWETGGGCKGGRMSGWAVRVGRCGCCPRRLDRVG